MPYPDAGPGCPIAGCSRERQADQLLCSRHWYLVPRAIRNEVYEAWDERLRRVTDPIAVQRYENAKRRAIEAVEMRVVHSAPWILR